MTKKITTKFWDLPNQLQKRINAAGIKLSRAQNPTLKEVLKTLKCQRDAADASQKWDTAELYEMTIMVLDAYISDSNELILNDAVCMLDCELGLNIAL